MTMEPQTFFTAIISAGAILTGFCGTFLTFRIQREASYYREPSTDQSGDSYTGRSHFTSSLLLLMVAAICSVTFGFIIPLLALSGFSWASERPKLVAGGLAATSILVIGYFIDELVHYQAFSHRLENNKLEWKREAPVVVIVLFVAAVSLVLINLMK